MAAAYSSSPHACRLLIDVPSFKNVTVIHFTKDTRIGTDDSILNECRDAVSMLWPSPEDPV